MNEKMQKIKEYKLIIILTLVLVILGVVFYWYEYRPSQIKKLCSEKVINTMKEQKGISINEGSTAYNFLYNNCLHSYGL